MGFHNVSEAGGIGLAVTGMTIVFVALILVSLFITALPRLLPFVNAVLPIVEGHHGTPLRSATNPAANTASDELVAAIAFALHKRRGE